MILTILFLIASAMALGPWFTPTLTPTLQLAISAIGLVLLVLLAVAAVITKLYRKASANESFVRTGMGGARVIRDGGTVVLPVIHQIIPVSLETMRLNVERRGTHALITRDNLRVDLSAEFYIKVQAQAEDILQAARSLGGRNVRPDAVSELVQEKLVSALRTVAATKDLVELHSKRDEFASSVQQIVTHDLASNGLTLESVTISALDQTDPSQLQERNVFDAQGLRKIAEITQRAKIERNEIEREAEQQITLKDVATRKKVLDMQRDQAEFEAQQRAKVANVQAERQREVAEFKIQQDEQIARREIAKLQSIETSEVQRQLAVEQAEIGKRVALIARQKEQETADIEKRQAVELAQRLQEIAIAEKERDRATAVAAALEAEAERESASQRVLTVTVASEAEREAQKKLIAAQQVINENKLRQQTGADVEAYGRVRYAEAERDSAELQYAAKLRLAQGEAEAAARRAEGDRATKMVDVEVERERVDVEQARVEVERQSLSNRQEFEAAALGFELEKLRIAAEKEARIASAESLGRMMAGADVRIFGDPETMAKMSRQFMSAAAAGHAVDGLLGSLPPGAKGLLDGLASRVVNGKTPNGHRPVAESSAEAVASQDDERAS